MTPPPSTAVQKLELPKPAYNIVYIRIQDVTPEKNPMMWAAKLKALDQPESKQNRLVGSSVHVDGEIIGLGNNYNQYHAEEGCDRRKQNLEAFAGNYLDCKGCDPKTHSEPVAIADAIARGNGARVRGAKLSLWGHIAPCPHCDEAITDAGIVEVEVIENAVDVFNLRANPKPEALVVNINALR